MSAQQHVAALRMQNILVIQKKTLTRIIGMGVGQCSTNPIRVPALFLFSNVKSSCPLLSSELSLGTSASYYFVYSLLFYCQRATSACQQMCQNKIALWPACPLNGTKAETPRRCTTVKGIIS